MMTTEEKNVAETSVNAYMGMKPVRETNADRIFAYIKANPNVCDLQISNALSIPINAVCGARNTLMKIGRIASYRDITSPYTGLPVRAWRVTGMQLQRRGQRMHREECAWCAGNGCQTCSGKGFTEMVADE